ncbi:site-specific tyrosine recombinase XerC [bacterium]|nr:site-specific tyrosine recombinase XerC [bacterium]
MPKRGQRRKKATGALDPAGLTGMAEKFFEWMRITNYSEQTVKNRQNYLGYFITWCEERGLRYPAEITKPIIERYQRYLFHYRKKRDNKALTVRSQHARLVPIRAYFKWLAKNNHILYNPAGEITLPRLEARLPQFVLTASEAEKILSLPDLTDPLGIRDRAILETLYSTGMRRMELINLSMYSLDVERGTIMVRQGKGRKDRMVPIGERAVRWTERYLYDVRPDLIVEPDEGFLFLTSHGEYFTPNRLTQLVRNYVNEADIGKKGACHLFRHTMATLMLENGADIRFIQQILGHVSLDTTQMYTHLSIRKLKEVHTLTHPAKMKAPQHDELWQELSDELSEETDLIS